MQTRPLGSLEVPVVGIGCNNFGRRVDAEAARAVVDAALETGATLFDTADVYGQGDSERLLGRALGGCRNEAVIATKFGMHMEDGPSRQGGHPDWVRQACDASLDRLGVEVIDLYQLHRPDDDVPISETLGALGELVAAGKVREIGCSNVNVEQLAAAAAAAAAQDLPRFTSVQNRYSVLTRDIERDGVLEACGRQGLGLLPYFPLESGLLTGKYLTAEGELDTNVAGRLNTVNAESRDRFVTPDTLEATRQLSDFAADRGHTLLDLAFSWLVAHPPVSSVIAGATTPEQVHANAAAATWDLDAAELDAVDRIVRDTNT